MDKLLKAGVNNPSTNHGKNKLPNARIRKFAGMKEGGIVGRKSSSPTKKYSGGGSVGHKSSSSTKKYSGGGGVRGGGCAVRGVGRGRFG